MCQTADLPKSETLHINYFWCNVQLTQPFPERISQVVGSYIPWIYSNKILTILLEIFKILTFFCYHYYNPVSSDTVFFNLKNKQFFCLTVESWAESI